jgi:hypothetical protein
MRQQVGQGRVARATLARAALAGAAALAMTIGLAACDRGTDPPPPGGDKAYPNLGTVPPRAIATPAADRAATLGSLQRDRESARYDGEAPAVDETRGSNIGALVGPGKGRDPRSEVSPAPDLRVERPDPAGGPPPTGGATVGAPNQQPNTPARTEETQPRPPEPAAPRN